jgi:hypothetical protein
MTSTTPKCDTAFVPKPNKSFTIGKDTTIYVYPDITPAMSTAEKSYAFFMVTKSALESVDSPISQDQAPSPCRMYFHYSACGYSSSLFHSARQPLYQAHWHFSGVVLSRTQWRHYQYCNVGGWYPLPYSGTN